MEHRHAGNSGFWRYFSIGTESEVIPIASGIRKLAADHIQSLPWLSHGGPVPNTGVESLDNDLSSLFADNSLPIWARSILGCPARILERPSRRELLPLHARQADRSGICTLHQSRSLLGAWRGGRETCSQISGIIACEDLQPVPWHFVSKTSHQSGALKCWRKTQRPRSDTDSTGWKKKTLRFA